MQERIRKLDDAILHGQKEIENMHEYYWENYTEMDQYGYEDFDNQQALLRVNATKESWIFAGDSKDAGFPFFGRVDFIYDGEEAAETFYIGIGNFSKESGRLPLVYDWRAPVSNLFYDYDKGEAYYDAPAGRMEGEVLSKWQYKIRGGKMIYAFESDVKIDDEVLKQELGSHGDVKLKTSSRRSRKSRMRSSATHGPDPGDPGRGRKRQNFRGTAPHCLSALSRPGKSQVLECAGTFAKRRIFRLYFPHSAGAWRGEYPGDEF